jgi:hypothetical protein
VAIQGREIRFLACHVGCSFAQTSDLFSKTAPTLQLYRNGQLLIRSESPVAGLKNRRPVFSPAGFITMNRGFPSAD